MYHAGPPGFKVDDVIFPAGEPTQAVPFGSSIASCPPDRIFLTDNMPSAVLMAVLLGQSSFALYEVSPIGEIESDRRAVANVARSFVGFTLNFAKQAVVQDVLELQPEMIARVRQMVSASRPVISARSTSKRDARRAFLKKQRKTRRAGGGT